jgi:hypothetical protein
MRLKRGPLWRCDSSVVTRAVRGYLGAPMDDHGVGLRIVGLVLPGTSARRCPPHESQPCCRWVRSPSSATPQHGFIGSCQTGARLASIQPTWFSCGSCGCARLPRTQVRPAASPAVHDAAGVCALGRMVPTAHRDPLVHHVRQRRAYHGDTVEGTDDRALPLLRPLSSLAFSLHFMTCRANLQPPSQNF